MSSASGASFLGVIVLAILALMVFGGILLIILGLIGRSKGGSTEGGACGACGYSVKGLETLNCPECGADLREVGIVRSGASNTGKNAMLISGIVMLCMTLLCCVSGFFIGSQRSYSPMPTAQPTYIQPAPSQPAP